MLLNRSQRSFLFLSSNMWVQIPISSVSFVDDLEVACDFTLNTLISLSLHLALLIKFLPSLLHIID